MQAKRGYFESEGVRYSYLTWCGSGKLNHGDKGFELSAAASPAFAASSASETAASRVDPASPYAETSFDDEAFSASGTGIGTTPAPRLAENAAARGEKPPVVLVHGFAQSAKSWGTVAEKLASDRKVYAIDLVGFGESYKSGNESAYSLQAMGRALVDFLRDRQCEQPLVVGYSLGGRVALSALLEAGPAGFAACTSGLVLESAGLGMASAADRAAAATRDAATARRLREMPLADFMTYWENLPLFDSQKRLPEEARNAVRAGRLANASEALAISVERAGQHAMPDRLRVLEALAELADTGTPVRYIAGQLDAKYSALAAELPAGVETAIVPDAGHNIHLERPDLFAALINKA